MSENPTDHVQVYIAAYLEDSERIHTIRDTFRYQVALDDYAPSDAHITVFPLVRVARSDLPVVRSTVRMLGLVGRTVRIDGAGVWPNMKNPRIILLDCDIDLEPERRRLQRLLDSLGVDTHRKPTPPHITLLKTNSARGMTTTTKRRLVRRIHEHRGTWETTIKYVDVVVKDDA